MIKEQKMLAGTREELIDYCHENFVVGERCMVSQEVIPINSLELIKTAEVQTPTAIWYLIYNGKDNPVTVEIFWIFILQ